MIGTGFAGVAGDIGVDGEVKDGFVFCRHGAVGLGGELNFERAVGLGDGGAMGDGLCGGRLPPPAPGGKLYTAFDAPLHFCPADGGTGVSGGFAREFDGRVELGGLNGRDEFHLEFRALVFLDVEGSAAWPTEDLDCHPTHQSVAGRGENTAKRAIIIGRVSCAGDFLSVGIVENHGEFESGDAGIFACALVVADGDSLVADRLAGPVESTVGKEYSL